MPANEISKAELVQQLVTLGVEPGVTLIVHCAFSRVRPVEGGPPGLIEALRAALGPQGTLVMPTMSYDDEMVFDPATTPCREEMGIVADTFWRLPGVLRSDNAHAFAAAGPQAATISAPFPPDLPHGPDTPVGQVYALDGQVLLLGVDQGSNTTIHLAENLAPVRYRTPSRLKLLRDGQPVWFEFAEVNHCCQRFAQMDDWLDERGLLRTGQVGQAGARLMRSRAIVETALEHLRADEFVFLHAPGLCADCDEAYASIPGGN